MSNKNFIYGLFFALLISLTGSLNLPVHAATPGAAQCDLEQLHQLEDNFLQLNELRQQGAVFDEEAYKIAAGDYLMMGETCFEALYPNLQNNPELEIDDGAMIPPDFPTDYSNPDSAEYRLTGSKWGDGSPYTNGQDATGPRTPGGTVTYSYMSSSVRNYSGDTSGYNTPFSNVKNFSSCFYSEIDNAFAAWSAVANIQFNKITEVGTTNINSKPSGSNVIGNIRIGGHYFDGSNGVLAHAYYPPHNGYENSSTIGGDMHFDKDENWSCSPGNGNIDIGLVAIHEIGHAIGLKHQSTSRTAMMNPSYNASLPGLQSDDKNGAVALYGQSGVGLVAPSNIQASDGTYGNRVQVTWNSVSGATSYEIWRYTSNNSSWATKIGTNSSTSYSDYSAVANKTYYYWVRSKNASSTSSFSNSDTGYITGAAAPSIPSGVSCSDGTYTDKIRCTWNASSGATKYYVYRATSSGGSKTNLGATTGTSFDDTSTSAGITYYYFIRAYSSYGTSSYSSYNTGWRAGTVSQPSGVSASDGSYTDRVRVTWYSVSGATGYKVYRATSSGGSKTLLGSTSTTTYNDYSATSYTTYYYFVVAYNSNATSDYSSYNTGWRNGSLSTPNNVLASDGTYSDRVRVTWSTVSNADGYKIYRATSSTGSKSYLGTSTNTYFYDYNATPGTRYYYFVKAYNSYISSNYSSYNTGYRGTVVPSTPTSVQASDGTYTNRVLVSWNTSTGATSYRVYRATSSGGSKTYLGSTSSSFNDYNAAAGTTYYYFVSACNSNGCSSYSSYNTGYRQATLSPPTNVQATDGTYTNKVRVSWYTVSGATGYKIYRAASAGGAKTYLGSTSSVYFDDSSASICTSYYYFVEAYNSSTTSSYSYYNIGYRNGTPSIPYGVSASDGTYSNKVRVSWNETTGATGYRVYRATSSGGSKTYLGYTTATYLDDSSASAGTTYYYFVRATSGCGTSGYSSYNTGYAKGISIPTNVRATDGTYKDKVEITWSELSGATRYYVYRATSSSGTKYSLGYSTGTSFDDTSANLCQTYYYFVRAYDGSFSNYSSYNSGYKDGTPSPPLNVQASDGTYTGRVRVSWSTVSGATSYSIYRANSATGSKSYLGISYGTYFYDYSAAMGTTYYYFIKASSNCGTGNYSSHDTGYVKPGAPSAPTNVQASDGTYNDRVHITWTSANGATSYKIYRATSSYGSKTSLGTALSDFFDDSTAIAGTTYYYWVVAYNSYGNSGYSSYNTGWAKPTTLSPPTSIWASDGTYTDRVRVTWYSVAGATSYELWRGTSSNSSYASRIAYSVSGTSFDDTSASLGQTYYYWVKAKNSASTSSFGNSNTGYTALGAPTNVQATDGTYTNRVKITWNSISGATDYELWRHTSNNSSSATQIATTGSTYYYDYSTTAGRTYYYWVKMKSSTGTSSFSSSDSGYQALSTPSVSCSSGTLSWSTISGATGYRVYRATTSTGTKYYLGATTATNYTDSSATVGTTYYYFVRAYNSYGNSSYSTYRTCTNTALTAPTNVQATDGTYSDRIRITWYTVSGATSYELWRSTSNSSASASLITTLSSASYYDYSVVAGQDYYYWVKAKNSSKTSSFSTPNAGYRYLTGGSVLLYIDPSTTSAGVDQIFTVDLKANSGTQTFDTVEAYLNFNPTYLEVVNTAGTPVTSIEAKTVLPSVAINTVNNSTGQINFSASKLTTPYPTGLVTIATIRFKAKATIASTSLSFSSTSPRKSDLLKFGTTMNPTITGGSVAINNASLTLNGKIALERRGTAGSSQWITPLKRDSTGQIELYQAGTTTQVAVFSATTDVNGKFSVALTGVTAGNYDIKLKGANTLSNKKTNVALPSSDEIDFGTLLVGDSNGDDSVTGADVSYMVPSFLKSSADTGFRPYADTNNDGYVSGVDVSALIPNFLKSGPVEVAGDTLEAGPPPIAEAFSDAALYLNPATRSADVGDIVTMTIMANSGSLVADTVDAYLDFDPTYLEVVDQAGTPVTAIEAESAIGSVTINIVDNSAGQINLSVSQFNTPYITGKNQVATIRFKVKAAFDATNVTFVKDGFRKSDLLRAGETISPLVTDGTISKAVLGVNFTATPLTGTVPLTVNFTDKSTGKIIAWQWSFGDGETSDEQNPTHAYHQPGSYEVTLVVTDVNAKSDTLVQAGYITATQVPFMANFVGTPLTGTIPLSVTFNDQSTGSTPVGWLWDLGDGTMSNEANPTHLYDKAGSYTVTLTVADADGAVATISKTHYITTNNPPLIADMEATPLNGTAPLTVTFNDNSTGLVTGWAWDFGDNVGSTQQNPVHVYQHPGSYTVTLTISDSLGTTAHISQLNYITVNEPALIADFDGTPISGTLPLSATFQNRSGGLITDWSWDFGDGTTSAEPNPIHLYNQAGRYTITLTIRSVTGKEQTKIRTNYIVVSEPVLIADFEATPITGTVPLTIQLSDESEGQITDWIWDFGDGTNGTEQNPVHAYDQAGYYTITLVVKSGERSHAISRTNYITVMEQAPIANIAGTPVNGTAPLTVSFINDPVHPATAWLWDFGDGKTSTEQNPTHIYEPGQFTVTLVVTGPGGVDSQARSNYIIVSEELLLADFSATPLSGTYPLSVTFTDKSTGFKIVEWLWDFGDGTISTEQDPVHVYEKPGRYTVILQVTNATSKTAITSQPDYITVGDIPQAAFDASVTTGSMPLTVTFTNKTTGLVTNWLWNFGDEATSTEEDPTHVYQQPGVYTVSLVATGVETSHTITRTNYITVMETAPKAQFSVSRIVVSITEPIAMEATQDDELIEGDAPLSIIFVDNSSGSITSWLWNFGDGFTSTERFPTHAYQQVGAYTITLSVTGPGGTDTLTRPNLIRVVHIDTPAPQANFEASAGSKPLSISFSDRSIGEITSWLWSFGDGSTSEEQNPTHTYQQAGNYTVSLTVTGPGGTSTVPQQVTIEETPGREKVFLPIIITY